VTFCRERMSVLNVWGTDARGSMKRITREHHMQVLQLPGVIASHSSCGLHPFCRKVPHLAMSRFLSCDSRSSSVAERQLLLPTPTWKLPGHDMDPTQRVELLVGLPYGSWSYSEPFAHALDVICDWRIPACSCCCERRSASEQSRPMVTARIMSVESGV